MKLHTFSKYFSIPILSALALSSSFSVMAEEMEKDEFRLQADTNYEIDLDQDGTAEQIFFSTQEIIAEDGTSKAEFQLYCNSELLFSLTEESQSYYWYLDQFFMDDQPYFLATCLSDNDYTAKLLLFTADTDSVTILDDLTFLSRNSEETPENPLSGWARYSYVKEVSENEFTLFWYDAHNSTGIITIPLTYEIDSEDEEHIVKIKEGSIFLDEEQSWTAWKGFDVQKSPEDPTIIYQTAPDETVHLTEYLYQDGNTYFKCVNEAGQEGWYADPSEVLNETLEDGSFVTGYFYEAFFAG